MEEELRSLEEKLVELKNALKAKESKEKEFAEKISKEQKTYIRLNVGGILHTTSRTTLSHYPESMLESLVSGRFSTTPLEDGSIFIDRDGTLFGIILNALRTGELYLPHGFQERDALARELIFYGLPFQVSIFLLSMSF
jgi:hypothetical protein